MKDKQSFFENKEMAKRFMRLITLVSSLIIVSICLIYFAKVEMTVAAEAPAEIKNTDLIGKRSFSPSRLYNSPPISFTDIPVGSYIIDMGSTSPTLGNSLKPHGLVFDLIRNTRTPIDWVISPLKGKDGIDFTYNGKAYAGGPFIIRKEFVTPAVTSAFTTWRSAGVIIDGPTASVIPSVPVAYTLTSYPRVAINSEKSIIVTPYFTNAGVPASAYRITTPTDLVGCDDIFVNQHGDPTWDSHKNLINFVTTQRGYVWAACHAVSVLEGLDNPATTQNPDMNFLSNTGLVNYLVHLNAGTPPYSYNFSAGADPIMQFIGPLDAATQNGSEQTFLPKVSWRSTTTVAVSDPTHPDVPALSPGEAGIVVYGRAFGNPSNGMVMYEGGHDQSGTGAHHVSAQRTFFNFVLSTSIEKGIKVTSTVPKNITSGSTVSLTGSATAGSPAYTYQWTSTCGGTFASSTSPNTTFTAPTVAAATPCLLKLVVTDSCSRVSFSATGTTISPATRVTLRKISIGGVGTYNFSGTNGFGTQALTTTVAGTAVSGTAKILTSPATSTVITETIPAGYALTAIACTGLGTGGTATNDLTNGKVTLNEVATLGGSNIICTFTNSKLYPILSITKSSNGPWSIGQSGAEYSLIATNVGKVPTSGTITVSDTLPTGISPNWTGSRSVTSGGITWNCTLSGSSVICTTSDVLPNTVGSNSSTINLSVNVNTSAAIGTNSVTNYASIGGGSDTFNSGSAPAPGTTCTDTNHCTSTQTTINSANLMIDKSHTGNFTRGGTGSYTLTVGNSGTADTSGAITLTDTLPSGLNIADGTVSLGGANAADWTCNAASNVITCTSSATIAIGGSSIFTFSVNVAQSAADSVINSVSVSGGNEATANNSNNSASDPTNIVSSPPNITLEKSCPAPENCTSAAQMPGTDITYKIQFTNDGGSGAANMTIIDSIPLNMDYKIGSAAANVASTGLSFGIEYSNDYDPLNPTLATWIYVPVSGGGGSSVGYDRDVKAIRWRVTSGMLSNVSPNNVGDISFVSMIR